VTIQDKQSGSELTGAVLGSKARLGINPFQSVSLRVGLRASGPGLLMAAPVYGYLNYRLIISTHTLEALQPGCGMRILSWAGLGFFVLVGFSFVLYRVVTAVGWTIFT